MNVLEGCVCFLSKCIFVICTISLADIYYAYTCTAHVFGGVAVLSRRTTVFNECRFCVLQTSQRRNACFFSPFLSFHSCCTFISILSFFHSTTHIVNHCTPKIYYNTNAFAFASLALLLLLLLFCCCFAEIETQCRRGNEADENARVRTKQRKKNILPKYTLNANDEKFFGNSIAQHWWCLVSRLRSTYKHMHNTHRVSSNNSSSSSRIGREHRYGLTHTN